MLLAKPCSLKQGSLVCLLASCVWRSGSILTFVFSKVVWFTRSSFFKNFVFFIQGLDLHIVEIEELCTEFPKTTVLLDHAGFCKVPEWAVLCYLWKIIQAPCNSYRIYYWHSWFHQPAEMVRQSLLILNSWSSLDSHRWKRKNINFRIRSLTSSQSHIIQIWGKNIETSRYMWNSVLYSGSQQPVSRIRTYHLSYLNLCPILGQIVSCGAGKHTYLPRFPN